MLSSFSISNSTKSSDNLIATRETSLSFSKSNIAFSVNGFSTICLRFIDINLQLSYEDKGISAHGFVHIVLNPSSL